MKSSMSSKCSCRYSCCELVAREIEVGLLTMLHLLRVRLLMGSQRFSKKDSLFENL